MTICAVCAQPIPADEAHYPHRHGCGRQDCDCDIAVHPDCCPDCQEAP
jgi:hypothetical protein